MSVTDPSKTPGDPPGGHSEWQEQYWSRNLRLTLTLLAIWALVSLVLSILLVEPLNNFVINGFPLGFWFAQQGSIIIFVALIFFYAVRMDRLDDEFGVSERDEEGNRL